MKEIHNRVNRFVEPIEKTGEWHTRFLLAPLFILALVLLLLNDFVLKAYFGNALTGKLSDFSGLFLFPFFISIFIPSRRIAVYISTAILFALWKSSLSQPLIDLINAFQIVRIGRTIDYSDLFAILVLPLSFAYFSFVRDAGVGISYSPKRASTALVLFLSIFAFTATSFEEDRSVRIDKSFDFEMTRSEFERQLAEIDSIRQIEVEKATDAWPADKYPDVKAEPTQYYLRFSISEKYRESTEIRFFGSFRDEGNRVVIDNLSFRYWCKEKPTDDDKVALTALFERSVAGPLER